MAELPHMPLATDAYLADTRHLSTLEHGAYLLLLMTAWRCRGRPQLPNDDKVLARYANVDRRTWQRIRTNVMAFWDLGADGFWTQAKQLRVRDVVNKNVENQRKKAERRWGSKALKDNESGDAAAYAGDMPDACQPKPKPSYTPIVPKGTRGTKRAAQGYGDEADPLFSDFLTNVWNKRWARDGHNRLKAYGTFARLSEADRSAVKSRIDNAARYLTVTRPEARFRPMLQTWLNGRGWEEEAGGSAATSDVPWAKWVEHFRATGYWNTVALGPPPGKPGCRVPAEYLIEVAA